MSQTKFHNTNLTDEAFLALLDALELRNEHTDDLSLCPYERLLNSSQFSKRSTSSPQSDPGYWQSTGTFIEDDDALRESELIKGFYRFAFDFESRGIRESHKFDDTLPSRNCSFISDIDTITPSTNIPFSETRNAGCPPRSRKQGVSTKRPSALYLPKEVPFSALDPEISESVFSLQSDKFSTEYVRLPDPNDPILYTSDPAAVWIKAAFNANIIMLRVSRMVSFIELKQRLYHKFAVQEGIRLSCRLTVVSVRPPPSLSPLTTPTWLASPAASSGQTWLGNHSNTDSISATELKLKPRRFSFAELTQMQFIEDEEDWQKILARHYADGTKVTIRILDTPT